MDNYFRPKYPGQNVAARKPEEPVGERKPMPNFVRTKTTGDKVFLVEGDKYHWIRNPEIYKAVGGDLGQEKMVEFSDLRAYSQGEPITLDNAEKYKVEKVDPAEIQKNPAFSVEKPQETPEIATIQAQSHDVSTDETVLKEPAMEVVPGKTSIIIPAAFLNYPLFHYTGHCIGSIREHTDQAKTPYEIILVINGSWKGLFKDLTETNAHKVITNDENMGYGYAMNQGIRASNGEYIVCMNNDVLVFDHWLEDMIELLGTLDLVMATPMYGKPYARAVEAKQLRDACVGKMVGDTFSTFRDFSCFATKRKLFEEIGTFNESFFAYKEDLDLFNRMDKAGKKYASTKRVNTYHCIGGTSVNMSEEDLHREEGNKVYEDLWGKK